MFGGKLSWLVSPSFLTRRLINGLLFIENCSAHRNLFIICLMSVIRLLAGFIFVYFLPELLTF